MTDHATENGHRRNRRIFWAKPVGVAIHAGCLGFLVRRPHFEAGTRNASSKGLELVSKQPLVVGARLKLWIPVQLNGLQQTVLLRGQVVWAGPDTATGLHISRIALKDRPEQAMQLWNQAIVERLRLSQA